MNPWMQSQNKVSQRDACESAAVPRNGGYNFRHCSSLILLGLTSGLLLSAIALTTPSVQAQAVPAAVSQGYTLLNRGWVKDAIAAFQQAVRQYPQSLEAKLGLATAYQRAGQDSNAWTAYQQVLAQDATNRTALKAVGMLGSYRSEWQAPGIAALTTLLQQTPNDLEARAQRALLYGYQGRFAEALADYQPVLQANPTPETVLQAAQIYAYSGNYAQSLALFDRYRSTGKAIPDNAVVAYATALRETGKVTQAIQILEARLKQRSSLDSVAIELRTALAIAYQANQQSEQALAVLAPLRGKPEATLPLARALSTIGRESRNAQLYREAIELYRQALQQTPNPSPGLMTEVADVLSEERSTRTEALQLYQQLLQQQPNNRSLQVKQLILAHQLGQLSSTELNQKLQAVLQPLPTLAADRQLLAQALIRLDGPDPQLLPLYQSLLDSGVDAPFLNFRIAQMQLHAGNLAAAKQALATYRATAIGSQDVATELLLAEIERREGNLEASAQRYEAIIARNPSPAIVSDALQGLAGIRQAQGRIEEALRVYDELLSRNPQDDRALLGKASLALQAQRITEAEAETVLNQWLQAHAVTEAPPELFSLVGTLSADPQREALYNQLLEIDSENLPVQKRLVQVLAMRDPAAARARVNQIVAAHSGDPTAYFIQGELAQALKDFQLAEQAYQAILQRQPNNVDALMALAGVRFQQQRYAEATALYNQVLALQPKDPELHRLLAELSLAQDYPLAALEQLQQLRQLQGASNPAIASRTEKIRVDLLKRRGFQPSWERY